MAQCSELEARYGRIGNGEANDALRRWGHYLGGCNRPFAKQSWGLSLGGQLVGVAVSASTVSATVAGYSRWRVVELARLCSAPGRPDVTRVTLRLWRMTAADAWVQDYVGRWERVDALVAYSAAERHPGHIYRGDGWTKAGVKRGSLGGGTWTNKRAREDKTLWTFPLGVRGESAEGVAG